MTYVAGCTDPLTHNRYTYVNGDPVYLVDPSGHEPCPKSGCTGQERVHPDDWELQQFERERDAQIALNKSGGELPPYVADGTRDDYVQDLDRLLQVCVWYWYDEVRCPEDTPARRYLQGLVDAGVLEGKGELSPAGFADIDQVDVRAFGTADDFTVTFQPSKYDWRAETSKLLSFVSITADGVAVVGYGSCAFGAAPGCVVGGGASTVSFFSNAGSTALGCTSDPSSGSCGLGAGGVAVDLAGEFLQRKVPIARGDDAFAFIGFATSSTAFQLSAASYVFVGDDGVSRHFPWFAATDQGDYGENVSRQRIYDFFTGTPSGGFRTLRDCEDDGSFDRAGGCVPADCSSAVSTASTFGYGDFVRAAERAFEADLEGAVGEAGPAAGMVGLGYLLPRSPSAALRLLGKLGSAPVALTATGVDAIRVWSR